VIPDAIQTLARISIGPQQARGSPSNVRQAMIHKIIAALGLPLTLRPDEADAHLNARVARLIRVHMGDCLDVFRPLRAFHSCITSPPYSAA
jgi:hypothetical protein